MTGDSIPDEDDVARHCRTGLIIRDPLTDQVTGVYPQAFRPKPGQTQISVVWVNFFRGTLSEQVRQTQEVLGRTRDVRKRDQLAVVRVEKIRQAGRRYSTLLDVVHDPIVSPPALANPAHALILGMSEESDNIQALIATAASVVPARP